jgi:phosphoenolpyruvate-protein kinase (PTS system EI component)
MAGDPLNAVLLIGLGVTEMSVSCFDLPRVKAAIRSIHYDRACELAKQALAQSSADGVRDLLRIGVEPLFPEYLQILRNER